MSKIKQWLGLNYYISEIDQFIRDFDKNAQISSSQHEIEKSFQRIEALRDQPQGDKQNKIFWDNF